MASAMQSMKPEHMAKLLAVTGAVQSALARAKAARAWVARHSLLVAALLVLLLAWLVRRWLARRGAATAAAEDMLRAATRVRPCARLLAPAVWLLSPRTDCAACQMQVDDLDAAPATPESPTW